MISKILCETNFIYFGNYFWEPFSHAQTLVKVANLGVGQNLKWKEVELCGMNCSSHGNNYEVFLNFSFPVEEFLRSMLAVSYSRIV